MKKPSAMVISFLLVWGALTSGDRDTTNASPRSAVSTPGPALSGPAFPDTLGYNIHFTAPQPGELKLIRDSGVRWLRTDFIWQYTEKPRGTYNFSTYDNLLAAMDQYQLRPVWVLDYGNPLYSLQPTSGDQTAVDAFARWAAAAAAHFRGRGVIWECWNEPPGFGFKSVDNYCKLALATGAAIKAVAPNEQFIGPATAGADVGYAAVCVHAGMWKYWTAVSIHPYVPTPESVLRFYPAMKARADIRGLPLFSSEWGYSTVGDVPDDATQAKYLARQWLVNAMSGIGLSIWYDWKDDGTDPKKHEHHFGVVHADLSLKPAYTAVKALTADLMGYGFSNSVPSSASSDYLLAFSPVSGSGATKYVVWTTAAPHRVSISVPAGLVFHQTSYLGQGLPDSTASATGLNLQLTDAPVYLESAK